MNILITGGAGYIGSHVAKQLLETTDHNIIILDNLSTGSKRTLEALKAIRDYKFIELDLQEFNKVGDLLQKDRINSILHFAASIVVPDSLKNPLEYYMNNTVNTANLIHQAIKNEVNQFIFSSTAAVYGEPRNMPKTGIDESYPANPINPYGMSKLMSEKILQDAANAHKDLKYIIFRYFNVAGADIHIQNEKLSPRIGQSFPNATHLIKIAAECSTKKRNQMAIYGKDFPTHDGTGIRDYIHVDDLADAHIKAINYLLSNESNIFNVGYGQGSSVKEVIDTMKEITKMDFKVEYTSRRAGDPSILIADNRKIKHKMGWKPQYENLQIICQSAYEWEKYL